MCAVGCWRMLSRWMALSVPCPSVEYHKENIIQQLTAMPACGYFTAHVSASLTHPQHSFVYHVRQQMAVQLTHAVRRSGQPFLNPDIPYVKMSLVVSCNDDKNSIFILLQCRLNPYPADHNYCRFLALVNQITDIGSKTCV